MKTGKHKKYSGELKQQVIDDINANHLSYAEAERKYGISKGSVQYWEKVLSERGPEALKTDLRTMDHASKGRYRQLETPQTASPEALLLENERLRAEVDYLKNLNALVSERVQRERKRK